MRINLKKTAIGTAIASAVVAGGIGLGSLTAQAAPTDTEPSAVSVEQAEAEIQADLKAETTISQEQAEQASLAANPGAKLAGETALASWDEETGPAVVTLDKRYGQKESFEPLSIDQAQELLSAAIDHAIQAANLTWDGSVLVVEGNPAILAAAADDAQDD